MRSWSGVIYWTAEAHIFAGSLTITACRIDTLFSINGLLILEAVGLIHLRTDGATDKLQMKYCAIFLLIIGKRKGRRGLIFLLKAMRHHREKGIN